MKVVFMGSPDFAVPSLDAFHKAGVDIPFCITQKDAVSRNKRIPTAVKRCASDLGIEVYEPDIINKDRGLIEKMKLESPDFLVVAAFGQIISKEILEIPKIAAVNVHASLLPKYRGAAPIQRAVLEGAEETGVTIMKMAEGLDSGDMISFYTTEVGEKTSSELFEELAKEGAKLLLETLCDILKNGLKAKPQNEADASYAAKVSKEEGRIDFNNSAIVEARRVRAFSRVPGAFAFLNGDRIKVVRARAVDAKSNAPGEVLRITQGDDCEIVVGCAEGALAISKLQRSGKKEMGAADFLKGVHLTPGDIFTSYPLSG